MKIQNIQQHNNIYKCKSEKKNISFCSGNNNDEGDYVQISKKKYKWYKFLLECCATWVVLDIIRDLYHFFSNNKKPPFP